MFGRFRLLQRLEEEARLHRAALHDGRLEQASERNSIPFGRGWGRSELQLPGWRDCSSSPSSFYPASSESQLQPVTLVEKGNQFCLKVLPLFRGEPNKRDSEDGIQ